MSDRQSIPDDRLPDDRLPDDIPDVPHDDYRPVQPTERHQVANDIASWIVSHDLAQIHGGAALRDERGRFYFVRFSRRGGAGHGDGGPGGVGQVNVFSPGYITVWWSATVPGLEQEGRRTFGSAEEAMTFMELAFVEGKGSDAMTVPERIWVRGRMSEQKARAEEKARGKASLAGPDNWRDYLGPDMGGEG